MGECCRRATSRTRKRLYAMLDFLNQAEGVPGATSRTRNLRAQAVNTHGGVSRATIGKIPRNQGRVRRPLKNSRWWCA
ncbi:hypothetical protein ACLB2K_041442 [Fragaria x ananassa]